MKTRSWEFLVQLLRRRVRRFVRQRTALLLIAGILSMGAVVAVFATSEDRLIHVFPTGVSQEGWMKEELALEQMLSGAAVFDDFTRDNSAFVISTEPVEEDTVPSTVEETESGGGAEQVEEGLTGNDEAVSTDEGEVTGEPGTESTEIPEAAEVQAVRPSLRPLADLSPQAYFAHVLEGYTGYLAFAQEAVDEVSGTAPETSETQEEVVGGEVHDTSTTEGVDVVDDTQSPESEELPQNSVVPVSESTNAVAESSDTVERVDDVRVCTVLGIECHTIEFTGFDIGSVLADHTVKGYELRLSLAARTIGESFTPDKLFVRYFYRGSWHLAGEISIDRELANFDNGGHFAFPMPNLEQWDALKDFKVEIEYVRQDTARTEVFLDSVWVDTTYEVNAADEEVPQMRNVLPELAVLEDSGRPDLLVAEEKRIELTKVEEDLGGDLVVRSDADVYSGLTTARAYYAVTNRGGVERSFSLSTHIGKQAEIVQVLERLENMPEVDAAPQFSEVAYFCESGWEVVNGVTSSEDEVPSENEVTSDELNSNVYEVTSEQDPVHSDDESGAVPYAENSSPVTEQLITDQLGSEDSSLFTESLATDQLDTDQPVTEFDPVELSTTYGCSATGETQTCNTFNADKTNCIVGNERLGVEEAVRYESGWHPLSMVERPVAQGKKSLLARLFGGESSVSIAPHLETIRKSAEQITLMPRETRYFAVDLAFPVQRAGEFVLEVESDDVVATKSAWWRSAFRYRVPLSIVQESTEPMTEGVPVIHDMVFERADIAALFEHAQADGSDLRVYDPLDRREVPAKVYEYTYVDGRARVGVDLGGQVREGTSTLYLYFGNEHVIADDRIPAPRATAEPIEYFGVAKPSDGAVVTVLSERDDLAIAHAAQEAFPLPYGHIRDLLIPDDRSKLYATAPLRVTRAHAEREAGLATLSLALPSDMQVTETVLPDGRIEYLLERYVQRSLVPGVGEVEELPLPAVDAFEPLMQNKADRINYLRMLRGPQFHQFLDELRDFTLGEMPVFRLQYQAQKGTITRFFKGLFRDQLARVSSVRLLHSGVVVEDASFEVVYGAEGEWTLRMTKMPREIVPGLYTLELTIDEVGTIYLDAFDFYWGVLAINTPQSIYVPDDVVEFHMAALTDSGDTICDADLRLTVTSPSGSAEEVGVEPQGTCGPNNVTDEPDYRAWYRAGEVGAYTLSLTHINLDGESVHQISDSFEVRESAPFTIRRSGATRIWPKATYTMSLELTATNDFVGQFIEAVPEDFVLVDTGGAETTVWGGAKRLVWDIDLKAGETKTFSYEYDAPDISPYLYLVGPAEVRAEHGTPFVEVRQWKLASDALGTYVELNQGLTIASASTWTTTDLATYGVPANAVVEVAILRTTSGNNTRTGGVRAVGSTLSRFFTITRMTGGTNNNVLTLTVQSDASSDIQLYGNNTDITFKLLGYWTSGTYTEAMQQIDPNITDAAWGHIPLRSYGVGHNDVAEMVVGNFNTGADYSAGIRSASSTVDRRVTLSRAINNGITPLTFLATASSTSAGIMGYAQVEGANNASVDYWLVGYWASTTVPENMRYVDRLDTVTTPTSATTWTDRALDSFGVGKYAVAEMMIANNSTTNNSVEIGVRANGSALGRTLLIAEARTGGWNPARMHVTPDNTGSSTIENYAAVTADATYRLLGYWRPSDYSPEAPTLTDVPFDNEKTGSSTPYFEFSATDPDGTSDLVYQFQWDDDADLDTSPLGDRTSDAETGCSPNCFENRTTGGDISPFTEGNIIRFTIQSALTTGTTYYWRVRAKDVTGSNAYGEWSDIRSITYVAGTDPKAWYQSGDAQFDAGTLTSTETYGADAVRIATTPPTGALIAYGEGAVQTPRYRTWDGAAWSSESSAQDVGGRISWTRAAAAPTRNEYVLVTQDTNGDVNAQVYNGGAGTWGNLREMTATVASNDRRAFDVAYLSQSGDAVVVYCDGDTDPSYNVWNGTNWSGTTTIDLQFNANCNWIQLAANAAADEIVLIAQADSTNTTSDFEAQVYVAGAWGNTYTGGANTTGEEYYERMAAAYEGSGGEAVVAFGNAGSANFVSAVWNSAEQTWTANPNRSTQDDFEQAVLVADDGTDDLGLCWVDEDNQLWKAIWNGTANTWNAWTSAVANAPTDQIDTATLTTGGTDTHAFGVSCQYETTAGRDGYLMVPYSDATNGRYRVWDGVSLTSESSISTIEDAWTVSSIRTGDGNILSVFRDNSNDRYDFAYWNGSAWSTRETLDTSMADDTEPYAEPVVMAAQRYQSSSGTIISPVADFDVVAGQTAWGEVLWTTTEPSNTDVTLQVMYAAAASTTCTSLVSNTDLPGNSTGFTSTSSPLNISGLSTSTYNRLCLKATLSSDTSDTPTLDDWSVSWERQPYLTQTHFKWYANTNGTTPSDVWPSGANALNEDDAITALYAPNSGEVLRLRLALLNENVTLDASSKTFTLQWAEGQTCSASLSWYDVGATSSSEVWRGYNNSAATDGATIPSRVLSTTDVSFTYEEENDTASNPSALLADQEGEFDFVIQHNATSSTSYCFRLINGDGTVLNSYDRYPQLITNAPPSTPVLHTPFTYEAVASTTPWFTFVAEDGKGDDIHYEIQVDDDYAFGSPALDRNSEDHFSEFTNTITPSDKSPFTSGNVVRFVPTSALTDNTVYWWRVRAWDPNGSNDFSSWSEPWSFTASSSVTISTWHQTSYEQFVEDDHEFTEATSTNDIVLTPPNTSGTATSPTIDFDWGTTGNAWGTLSWIDNETTGDIRYHIEYYNGSAWVLIPDSALSGNGSGYGTGAPISLLGLDPTTYDQIRVRANFTYIGGSPRLNNWTIAWGLAVEQPTLVTLFDNEKVGTTTPSFTFYSNDPQSNDLQYEFQWSSTPDFAASTTRTSGTHSGFINTASSTDTSPFVAGNTIRFTVQSGDALVNGSTYWWRVRAKDPGGGDTWSVYSPIRSFTVDTSVVVSTWYQTTDDQFDTDTLNDTETYGSNQVRITSTIREALTAYAEGNIQTPRYRLWNGQVWGSERSGQNVGERIDFVRTVAAPTRDEYVMVTQGASGAVKAQVYDGVSATWGDMTNTLSVSSNATYRGYDVAYETTSGDAMVVSCYGQEATYTTWDGNSWSATSTITLSIAQSCQWVQLAADPTSNEIILMVRMNTAGTADYEALVWDGGSWGNSTLVGNAGAVTDEGMAVMYEESGTDAVIVFSDGINNDFGSKRWNGTWQATTTTAIGNDLNKASLCRDLGTDRIMLAYIDEDTDIGYSEWNGTANTWGASSEMSTVGVSETTNAVSCEYETLGSRDGYVMFTFGDTTTLTQRYRVYDRTTPLTAVQDISTLGEAYSVFSARTGDGLILSVFFDDDADDYLFSEWDGVSAWSAAAQLETDANTQTTRTEPISIVARRYTAFTSGSLVSDPIVFSNGTGPRWGYASSTDTTPGSSYILYQLEYSTDGGDTWALIPDAALPGNSTGTTSNSIDLSNVSYATYGTIRYVANFVCVAGDCPILHDWTVSWSEGITISGTAKQYDESTNVTSGTVVVAVNGVLQSGKTGTISGGTWTIPNVTMFPGDIITIYIDGASDPNEATMVTHYDGFGNMTGVELFERHLTVGSLDATTTTNADIALYDYSSSGDEDLFFDVDAGNDLYVCAIASGGCFDAKLYVATSSTYRPDSANSGTLYVHDVVMYGTTTADSNTFYVSGSWDNNGNFSSGNGTVVFSATSTSENIDSTGASSYAFNALTFGQSNSATWTAQSILDANGTVSLSYGTLVASTSNIFIGGDLTLASGVTFVKGSGTTTFDGATVGVVTDSTAAKQDLGKVYVNGSSKTVRLGAAAKMTELWIETTNTFDVSATNHALEILGDFHNHGTFSARQGTVTFTSTTTGKVIDPGTSSFYNLTTNGVGGNWAFQEPNVSITSNLTVATGTLTMPTGTTTITGNLTNSGGTLVHNNGTVELIGSGSKTITQNGSLLYHLTFNGAGSWSWADTSATSSGTVRISNGTVTLPSGTLSIGRSLINTGGTLTVTTGTVRFTSAVTETVRTNGSRFYHVTFDGVGGTFTLSDTNLTASGTVRFVNGTTTLPSGTFTVGGSFLATGGTWQSNSGTVAFNTSGTGYTIDPGQSTFNAVTFLNDAGGWTVSANATSTGNWTIASSSSFTAASGITIAVGGTFTNRVPSATTWTGSTLYLNSGTSYTVGSKTQSAEVYGTLRIGANTDVAMWQSTSTAYVVDSTGSLYSQDHGNVDGLLYIYGTYERTSGTEYWSYATDFDGTALGGSSRQVSVRFADGASAQFSGATLNMVGGSAASTTVSNQGAGTYGVTLSGSTINAQYYSFTNLSSSGLSLLASTTVTSLHDGAYTLTQDGGSMITVSSSTIDTNQTLQLQRIDFSTSTGVSSGYNVTATGTATSYWWFRNHSGNYDGESYDNDPVVGAGSLRWDDSGFTISVQGTVYAGEAEGGAPAICDGSTPAVRLLVDGVTPYTTSCAVGSGAFTFPAVTYTGDVVLTAYINDSVGTYAATVSRSPQSNTTGFDLYQNRVIVRHEGLDALTIANMTAYDSDQDTDIPFDAESGSLTVNANTALHVWSGKTFTPGGNVTLNASGGGAGYDGTLRLAGTATFVATGGESHVVGGSFIADTGATFTAANSTVTFTATTSGKVIAPSSSFYNATFSGSGGAWTIASSTTVSNALTVSSGTVSGTQNITVQNGALSGNGTIAMTGGTVTVQKGGTFGGNSNWSFNNLTLGDGTANITSKSGTGNVTVAGTLTVAAAHILQAGSVVWTLNGTGAAFAVSGTFTAQTSTTTFAGTSAMTVPALTYNNLVLAPSAAGSPTYTLAAGTLAASTVTVGNGTNPVTVNVTTNDPLMTLSGTLRIKASATVSASNSNDIQIGGSYINQGTFTSNGGGVLFNSTDTGETIDPGGSSFHHVAFNAAGGGWTILGNTTATGNFTLTSGTAFTQTSGTTLEVQGTFTNAIGGSATTWSGTTLYLNSGTAYSANTKSAGGDTYSTLQIGANTDIRLWNSTSTTYTVAGSGSLVSQDHNSVDGSLYIWGDYERSSGSEYWSYATDFDGTDISGSPRQVNVRLAPNATTTLSGGSWNMVGGSSATTTVAVQGSGTYALRVTGGTFNAQYYRLRDLVAAGLEFSGSPTVTSLSDGDIELGITGGTMMTVPASVITANPAKTWYRISFATSTGVTGGANVTTTGTTVSSWRFTPALGNYYGEQYNSDPAGDPGYLVWDDSNAQVTIGGNVYSNESGSVSGVCNGSTPVVRLVIQGGSPQTTSCAAGTGAYSISGITYSPGDTIMVYLDTAGGAQAANITVDPLTSISDMHLYEDRVVVRHEDTNPITIDDLAIYDSSDDPDIPFTAVSGSPDSLTLGSGKKLIVWAGKTFTPGGSVTLTPATTANSWDGTLELQSGATFTSSSSVAETISVGGSFIMATNATFSAGLSNFAFTSTAAGKVVQFGTSSTYNLTFNGSGGSWTYYDRQATTTNDLTITTGDVTFGTTSLAVGGSFVNSAVMSAASTSISFSSASPENVTLNGYSVGNLTFRGSGAHTMTDSNATSTGSVSITAGSAVLPSGTFAVANGFSAQGGTFSHAGTLRLYGTLAAQTIRFGTSQAKNLTIAGQGSWAFADMNATTTGTTTISQGGLTAPSGGFGIGGSFINAATFNANGGQVNFYATSTGHVINASSTVFANVLIKGTGGGWTFATSASSTGAFRLATAASFAMAASTTLEVQGTFENLVGGSATDFSTSTLYLNSGTSYTVNTKSAGGDSYAYLRVGPNTDIRMWDSAGATTTVATSSSLYSMDHAGVSGDLYIWGEYAPTGSDYWSYASDFDGTALGGSSRQVDVRIASSSSLSFTSGTLEVVGTAAATTTIAVQGTGAYSLAKSGGTFNAQYYQVRNLDAAGIVLSGSITVTSLSYGDLELSANGGVLLQVASSTIDQNPSKSIVGTRFGSSTGVSGTNVTLNGTTANFWDFTGHYGEIDGEAYDNDGVDACGALRWDDSTCLEVSQAHYRFRNDDGGGGAPDTEWYDADWSKRKRVNVTNPNASTLTNVAVRFDMGYDADMQSNWDDIRFTDSSGTTSLPYFVEEYTTSATATVWVKVPSVPANGSTFIYAYYGNAFAANAESGANTFTFFDDFEDDNISEYSGDTSYFDVVADAGAEGAYVLQAAAGYEGNQTTDGIYRTGTTFAQGSTIRWMQHVTASQDDEPCTLFGVQTPGTNNQNYAVCLDQYPSDKLILTKNVASNDGSGLVGALASTSVTWASDWYTVEVDWLSDNSITVTVYDSTGAQFATVNATDSSYTSGGMGFSFWYQSEAWDFYTARPYVASEPTTSIGPEQGKSGASWKAAQDTPVTQDQGVNLRVRFSIENSGPQITSKTWRLQYADKTGYGTCNAVPSVDFNDVPAQAGCGVNPICLTTTSQYADQDTTQELLTPTAFLPFTEGRLVESPSNQTSAMTLEQNQSTEVEYSIELTSNAVSDAYCMRVSDGGVELDSYQTIAEVTANYGPQISSWTFNENTSIALVEGQTVSVVATGTVTDLNGFEDLLYATSTFYRTGVGATCADDPNNCYQLTSLQCPLSNCSGNSCEVTCTADIEFYAEPTDPGSTYQDEAWTAKLYILDTTENVASSTADNVELLTLWGVGLTTGAVDYGSLELGADTGAVNATTTLQNTGNAAIDIGLEGTDMTAGASNIPVTNQKFSTSTFTYAACVICNALSGTASTLEVDLPKPTSATPITDDLYWGVYVPMGVAGTTHEGQNTFYATGD